MDFHSGMMPEKGEKMTNRKKGRREEDIIERLGFFFPREAAKVGVHSNRIKFMR